jgi:hypothetical protein
MLSGSIKGTGNCSKENVPKSIKEYSIRLKNAQLVKDREKAIY